MGCLLGAGIPHRDSCWKLAGREQAGRAQLLCVPAATAQQEEESTAGGSMSAGQAPFTEPLSPLGSTSWHRSRTSAPGCLHQK
jgi:hypothetical protein